MSVDSCLEKFNVVSNDHGRTQKCNFCVSFFKTDFTDHHTPDTINGCWDSVLVCKILDGYCTIRKNFEHPSIPCHHAIYGNKPLQNPFKLIKHYIYLFKLYSISIILRLKNNLVNICSKISNTEMNLWMVYIAIWKALESTKDGRKKVNVLCIVDRNHSRSVVVLDHFRNFKEI